MKKLLLCSAIALLSGCLGETFKATGGGEGDTIVSSGGTSGSGGSGGNTMIVTTSNSTSTTSSSTGGSPVLEKYSVSDAVADYVFVPWTGYDLVNSPAVSCLPVPEGKNSLTIDSFTYNLFQGMVIPTASNCDASDHPAVWFVTKLDVNGEVVIPGDVILETQNVSVANLEWSDWSTPDLEGQVASVNVEVPNSVTIMGNELFCFGHRFTNSVDANPTCLVSSLNEKNYRRHQISDSKNNPYNFNPTNSWPPDGNVNVHYSFEASVLAFSQ